jgi:sterol desaturase/sphingolipid hydroxylase (fatty acid hydroxylase superfamily)
MVVHVLHHHHVAAVAVVALALLVIGAEILAYRHRSKEYAWNEVGTSIAVAVIQRFAAGLSLLALTPISTWLWQHRLWTLPVSGVAGFAIAVVMVEFAYYWMHRASHRVNWLWATHSVHHSAEQLNFFAAIRLGATGIVSLEWLAFAAIVVLTGISPSTITGLFALDLVYQFFLHSDIVPRLDARQWLFNTPSDHRVHHAINAAYIDRNFGGMLIVFDRFFGTYAPERVDDPPRYGLRGERRGGNPLRVLLGGWLQLAAKFRAASPRDRWSVVFGPPAASP